MRLPTCLCIGIIISGWLPGPAPAAWEPVVGTEFFSWQERTAKHANFVSEYGTRTSFGIRSTGAVMAASAWEYEINAISYSGTVRYQGHTVTLVGPSSSRSFASYTDYEGARLQVDLMHPLRRSPQREQGGLEGTVALGVDTWMRTIRGGRLTNNTDVSGYRELYQDVYAKTGIKWHGYFFGQPQELRLGFRFPVSTEETVYLDSLNTTVALQPGGKRGIYLNWELSPDESESRMPAVTFFLEHVEYAASDTQRFSFSTAGGLHQSSLYQPASTAQTGGISLLWSF